MAHLFYIKNDLFSHCQCHDSAKQTWLPFSKLVCDAEEYM